MLRKLYIVIDCDDEVQVQTIQNELNQLSNSRVLTGKKIMSMLPYYKSHRTLLNELFKLVSQGGIKAVLSMKGAQLMSKLSSK